MVARRVLVACVIPIKPCRGHTNSAGQSELRYLCSFACDVGCFFALRLACSGPGPSHPHYTSCLGPLLCIRVCVCVCACVCGNQSSPTYYNPNPNNPNPNNPNPNNPNHSLHPPNPNPNTNPNPNLGHQPSLGVSPMSCSASPSAPIKACTTYSGPATGSLPDPEPT